MSTASDRWRTCRHVLAARDGEHRCALCGAPLDERGRLDEVRAAQERLAPLRRAWGDGP